MKQRRTEPRCYGRCCGCSWELTLALMNIVGLVALGGHNHGPPSSVLLNWETKICVLRAKRAHYTILRSVSWDRVSRNTRSIIIYPHCSWIGSCVWGQYSKIFVFMVPTSFGTTNIVWWLLGKRLNRVCADLCLDKLVGKWLSGIKMNVAFNG